MVNTMNRQIHITEQKKKSTTGAELNNELLVNSSLLTKEKTNSLNYMFWNSEYQWKLKGKK